VKKELTQAMDLLAADPAVRFIGYGVKIGGRAAGTLNNVADAQLIETPVAENLMVGLATGLSLAGLKPVVFIERMDFILNALDAFVIHLGSAQHIRCNKFKPAEILRLFIGNKNKPLYTGPTHTQDFTEALRKMIDFPIVELKKESVVSEYQNALHRLTAGTSIMLVERKDEW
jgi:pyruvate/2-oxoglutarate/acetoin dehydrogenase E1 component